MVTAYDYPSALHVDRAGIDILLVGDSVAMVELGYPTTQPLTMDEMLHHCRAVSRSTSRPLLVGDMPLGSYEVTSADAIRNAHRFVKEAGMDAVKLEGARHCDTMRKIVEGGVAVMGHVGLLPQAISTLGGFRAQGRTAARAREIVEDALRIQDAGAFAVVIECVPENVARVVTEELEVPSIGIGSGRYCDGQVLVYHDLLGMSSHPHHESFCPKFCKKYADVGNVISRALDEFREDVTGGVFPSEEYSPYKMSEGEKKKLEHLLMADKEERQRSKQEVNKKLLESDEYEVVGLYGQDKNGNNSS
eukprot:CAMPEP_0172499360 /NCGR_PEP_ID=MMETSP1066-20121228/126176_1 /TAXON_ID=671091 /ORGANISM="Coscinodiscus wailesii, Strain CCMP2513" /LENGTH=304 /DNA_ID=CAMNT_0013273063 /DNA_START=28 /DNA_END=940 /DNA_ORIENTATION=+